MRSRSRTRKRACAGLSRAGADPEADFRCETSPIPKKGRREAARIMPTSAQPRPLPQLRGPNPRRLAHRGCRQAGPAASAVHLDGPRQAVDDILIPPGRPRAARRHRTSSRALPHRPAMTFARADPRGVLHRAARPAPGEPAHRRLLPGHLLPAAAVRPAAPRQTAVEARLRRVCTARSGRSASCSPTAATKDGLSRSPRAPGMPSSTSSASPPTNAASRCCPAAGSNAPSHG